MGGLRTMVRRDKDSRLEVECLIWLCSLSELEIDMLISLKLLIFQRAKTIGYADLAKKFNLKIIRAIAVVLMEHLKEELKDLLLVADTDKSASFLDACKLLKCYKEGTTTFEELITDIGTDIQAYLRRPSTYKREEEKDERK
ncbi:hypothetical protein HN51_027848 [Arachis hypogaea]|uniref:Uncharacterized protein LOC107465129 isoform X1 n=1 Tax=Arachis duranensis TaxID=130453 RepID=A0A6P4BBN7_ARADU|nr:uncharacterized protein LOC107465129 isoform X1 [Arachis duranensis]XP_025618844.1 uncharacterized protein LOC112710697 isoform X1 [Arachis hypogaea]XP_029144783.1 uncharacterized protein LOC112710697 isoform X1 [Arachis hypogaea]XP_052109740.1 uncharacterized protein LOC107465129 isoform X1 [Arachis duranensis]XP_052109741.1 uncharacterized protein LOC107465129 isoform X1 [Arachis duranensis]QHO34281.1 Gamma-tubulin complex component [Arachis hypogaea]